MSSQSHIRELSTRLLTACRQGSLPTVRSTAPSLYRPANFSASAPTSTTSSTSTSTMSTMIPPLKIVLATAAQHGQAAILHYLLTNFSACSSAPSPWNPPLSFPDTLLPEKWKEAQYPDLVVLRAVQSSYPGVVQTLLDAGMEVDHQMDKIGPPLGVAISDQNVAMVRFLLEKGACANEMGSIPPVRFLARAAALPSRDILVALLAHGAELPGSGALFAASETGNIGAAEVLLDRGADVNEVATMEVWGDARDVLGTALHAAAKHGQGEMAKFLMKHGARKDLQDGESNAPRDIAEKEGKTDIVRILDEAE